MKLISMPSEWMTDLWLSRYIFGFLVVSVRDSSLQTPIHSIIQLLLSHQNLRLFLAIKIAVLYVVGGIMKCL